MVSLIPPKPRDTAKLSYYTMGQSDKSIKPAYFKSHVAEPSVAATILERNPPYPEVHNREPIVKPLQIRTGGYTPGLYAGRADSVSHEWKGPTSLSEAKLANKKVYAS